MRIPITLQLGGLLLISSLIGLAVISVAVWITVHDFVLDTRASRLAVTASLKAGQLTSNLDIMQTSASFVTSRVLVQSALQRYNDARNNTPENWVRAVTDMQAAVGGEASLGQQLLLQSRLYSKDDTGPAGPYSLMNTTANSLEKKLALPYGYPNGSQVYLGANDTTLGYPPSLYPNLTFSANSPARFGDFELGPGSTLLLGPWDLNSTFSLVSLTMPITNNSSPDQLLGYVTLVMNARLITQVIASSEGLLKTGKTLLLGPADPSNKFPVNMALGSNDRPELEVRYVFGLNETYANRHPDHAQNGTNPPFSASEFPAVYQALDAASRGQNSGAQLRATNEAGKKVSVGYAMLKTDMVSWAVLVELSRKEVWQPIDTLRKVILACFFATGALMAIVAFPLAHFATKPIMLLRAATQRSIDPPSADSHSDVNSLGLLRDGQADERTGGMATAEGELARKEGFQNPVTAWRRKRDEDLQARREERRKRHFRIPGKVHQRKGYIKDELFDLTRTFNEMSDELMMQYSKMDERVKQRTAELELSKKAAEAANESKTLFIANISHELKTPLNGILGMCAVCMQEDDPLRMKRSLGIIYKSGDLLLNLLTDLLTFSKNQVGQHLSLDEKEFRLRDVSSQILAIFENQAKEGQIDLKVQYEGIHHLDTDIPSSDRTSSHGPGQSGRMRDMILWGDIHRILQVVINLVSNSLKFTPPGGSVVLTVRALPELPDLGSRKTSFNSRQSVRWSSHKRDSDLSVARPGLQRNSDASIPRISTANAINARDKPHALINVSERTRSPSSAKYIYFEFEVADTGPGIPEDAQEKIFEPFMQGDLGLSKKFGGTGLGLSICSQLAALMKGTVYVRSTVGLGSTFTMKIPLRHVQTRADSSASSAMGQEEGVSRRSSCEVTSRTSSPQRSHGPVEYAPVSPGVLEAVKPAAGSSPEKSHAQQRLVGLSQPYFTTNTPLDSPNSQDEAIKRISATASRSGKIRVLVAEDNKINQEVVLRMLKLEDIYDVVVAKDGQEALDVVKESMRAGSQPFNLIFMDVQMPNVDGLTSTRLIREIGYQAPIVALTAFAEESNIKDCMDSGMNYFLSKPIRRPQLKKVLKAYIPPIPEEAEEPVTPPDERGGTHNTTIVMVQGRSSQDSKRLDTTTESADATFDTTGNAFHAPSVARVAKDEEPAASPGTIV